MKNVGLFQSDCPQTVALIQSVWIGCRCASHDTIDILKSNFSSSLDLICKDSISCGFLLSRLSKINLGMALMCQKIDLGGQSEY